MTKTVTAEELEYGLGVLARIMDAHGDPISLLYERMEYELENMRSRRVRVDKFLQSSSLTRDVSSPNE